MPRASRSSRSTVAVTGASGYIGSALVRALCRSDRIDRVLGFDVRPCGWSDPKLVFDTLDVRDPTLGARLGGVDVLVHLAFVMDPIKDEGEMRDINVNGSHSVLRAAGRAAVRKIVYTSSAVVYGAHPDNEVPLTETSPLRANLDFPYSAHKLEVEYVVREFRAEHPDAVVTVFRPATVLGPHVDNAWSHVLEMPVLFGVAGHSPPFQFVHEDDVGAALEHAVFDDLEGAFNLAAPGWLTADEIVRSTGRRRFDLPEPAAFALAERMWSLGLAEVPAGMLHYVMHPWVVSTEKLAAAGFTARRSNRDALEAAIGVARQHVRIGRRRVRRTDLRRAAAATVGIGGGLVGMGIARRRAR
ncbi:MAG: NAD-dependent epimerase/dehydratase family protein [Actinomycetota bacterium]